MERLCVKILGLVCAVLISSLLTGCYLYSGDSFADWPEVRVERANKLGDLVAKVRRRTVHRKGPGESYVVMIRWPTNIPPLMQDLSRAERESEAKAFVETLCGEGHKVYVISHSFNDHTGEVYYNLWCRPSKVS